jgi:hypothetical protein
VRRHIDKALGDPSDEVTVEKLFPKQASVSPTGAPLWDVLGRVVDGHYPGAKLLPLMIVGFTDAPYFREHGAVAYGFGLFRRALTAEAMSSRFHGNDERVDVESPALTTQAWLAIPVGFTREKRRPAQFEIWSTALVLLHCLSCLDRPARPSQSRIPGCQGHSTGPGNTRTAGRTGCLGSDRA